MAFPVSTCGSRDGWRGRKPHAAEIRQVEGGAQVHIVVPRTQGVGEQLVRMAGVVFGRQGAQRMKVGASRFAAVGGDGESQLYIFPIGGRNVRARVSHRFNQAAKVV